MTPEAMAALYAAAFPATRAWSAAEIADLLATPGAFSVTASHGFALGRAIAGEAELVTIAVAPSARRHGTGSALLARFEAQARTAQASAAFLEVAADNAPALALYRAAGWAETGRRRGYYARPDGAAIDAVTMHKPLS